MSEKSINLKPVWNAILEIYGEVAKICDRHGLRYYVTDGTLIGVIRHKGFIPWDDDFDMSMPREDYEKFIEYAQNELPPYLKFVNWKNTPEFGYLFGKVQDCRRERIESIEAECHYMLSNGLYLDVIPIDGYPKSSFEVKWSRLVATIMRPIWRFRCAKFANQTRSGKVVWMVGGLFSMLFPWIRSSRQIMGICENLLIKHPFTEARQTGRASLYLHMLNRKPLPAEWWGEAIWLPFENVKVPVPHDYDAYLRFYFGDYMKLPPVEAQQPCHGYGYRCAWWLGPTLGEDS